MLNTFEIQTLQQRYRLLGDYLPSVLLAREKMQQDAETVQWIGRAAQFAAEHTIREMEADRLFSDDSAPSEPFAFLFVLLEMTQTAIREYLARGFTESEIAEILTEYEKSIEIVEKSTGRPGLDRGQFFWLMRFIKTRIFFCGGLIFELCPFHSYAVVLNNAETRETAVLRKISFAAEDDPSASRLTPYEETDTEFIGCAVQLGSDAEQTKSFGKAEWLPVFRPGDMALSLHIPQGANLSKDVVADGAKSALAKAKERFPEYSLRGVFCVSWMLNPCLDLLLPDGSRIREFASLFVRYPAKNTGEAAFDFVFSKRLPPNELPENTSLQRALKQWYLAGNRVSAYAGILRMGRENEN